MTRLPMPPGENKDASRIFLFIFFYPNRILFVARDTKGGEDETVFLLFWYATAPLVKRMFLLSFFGSKLCWDR